MMTEKGACSNCACGVLYKTETKQLVIRSGKYRCYLEFVLSIYNANVILVLVFHYTKRHKRIN